jgi:L-aminopeptidase/D-esterase-like protein
MGDGDTIFAIATATRGGGSAVDDPNAEHAGAAVRDDVSRIGALGAEMIAEAVIRAVRQATSIPGYPAARDISAP